MAISLPKFSTPSYSSLASHNLVGGSGGGGHGSGTPYGTVPGPIANPPSIYDQLQKVIPGLSGLTSQTANTIGSEVAGNLSPGTLNLLQDKAAQYGVSSGMPGLSGLSLQNLMQNIGLTSETLSQQGTKDYINFLTGTGSTMADPALTAQISDRNAMMAAAPDPAMAAQAQLGLLDKYLAVQSRPGAGSMPASNPGFSFAPSAPSGGGGGHATNPALDKFWGFSPQQDYIATTSGIFPKGTPNSITNPGTSYSDYYPSSGAGSPTYQDNTYDSTWSDPTADYWV